MKDYRKIITAHREAKGWSQYRLAKEIGLTQSFVNHIESGRKSPSIETFFKICGVLDIKLFPDE